MINDIITDLDVGHHGDSHSLNFSVDQWAGDILVSQLLGLHIPVFVQQYNNQYNNHTITQSHITAHMVSTLWSVIGNHG